MAQLLLIPDPRPLVERLGADFFRRVPEVPGVYLMHGAADVVLYVGKAKSLRHRLGSYRVANPERLARRTLRLLHSVERIAWEECLDEAAALRRESELLLSLRPRFNRAGTWPSSPWYLVLSQTVTHLELAITETPESAWLVYGPRSRRNLIELRTALTRVLWCVLQPQRRLVEMPPGWVHGNFGDRTLVPLADQPMEVLTALGKLFCGGQAAFVEWVKSHLPEPSHAFERAALEVDFSALELIGKHPIGRFNSLGQGVGVLTN